MLIDTDTFFRQSPMELLRRVKPGHLLCNAICARYGENPNTDLYQGLRNILHARGLADDHMNWSTPASSALRQRIQEHSTNRSR